MRTRWLVLGILLSSNFGIGAELPEMKNAKQQFKEDNLTECLASLKAAYAKDNLNLRPAEVTLGEWLYASNKRKVSRKMLEEYIARNYEHPDGYLLNGKIALVEGRFTEAIQNSLSALNYSRAPAFGVLQQKRMEREARLLLVDSLEARGDYQNCVEHMEALIRNDPQNAKLNERLLEARKRIK